MDFNFLKTYSNQLVKTPQCSKTQLFLTLAITCNLYTNKTCQTKSLFSHPKSKVFKNDINHDSDAFFVKCWKKKSKKKLKKHNIKLKPLLTIKMNTLNKKDIIYWIYHKTFWATKSTFICFSCEVIYVCNIVNTVMI